MEIIFVDSNKKLVEVLHTAYMQAVAGLEDVPNVGFIHGTILEPTGVVVTASNPDFTMGGGWDTQVARWFPFEIERARNNKGANQRINDVIFTITVDEHLNASKKLVSEALKFALDNVKENETLILTGLGTGIGGLSEEDFIEIFMEVIKVFNYEV